MTGVATAIAGAAIVGGVVASRSASKAGKIAEETGESQIAELRAAREQAERLGAPFVALGTAASGALGEFLGFPQAAQPGSALGPTQGQAPLSPRMVEFINAFGTPEQKNRLLLSQSAQPQANVLDPNRVIEPAEGGEFLPTPSLSSSLEEINPVVSFLREQGFEAIQESAAAQGRLGAGGTLKDLARFNAGLESTIIPGLQQQRFNQDLLKRQQEFNELFNVTGLGANVAAGQGTQAVNTATGVANVLGQVGAGQQQAVAGQAGAVTGTLSNLAGIAGAFPSLFGGGGGGGGGGTAPGTFNIPPFEIPNQTPDFGTATGPTF